MSEVQLCDVPIEAIRLTGANPRSDGAADLAGLIASLAHGLAQRPTLIETAPGEYEVLTGERRVRAGLAAGWPTIPAVVEPALDPIAAHTRRLVENLHRADLAPLDEARALKLGWLCANADALELRVAVNAALSAAGNIPEALEAVAGLLAAASWSPCRPPVTQESYLRSLGLGLSTATLRKKLQVLNLSAAAQAQLDTMGLTAAGIRAFVRLSAEDQAALLAAIAADPTLAKDTRTIVQWVVTKGRTMEAALAIARGQVLGAERTVARDDAPDLGDAMEHEDAPAASRAGAGAGESNAPVAVVDEQAAAELVLPLMETVQTLAGQLAALAGVDLAQLPAPWESFAREALTTILTTIQLYLSPRQG